MTTVATGQFPPAGFAPAGPTTSVAAPRTGLRMMPTSPRSPLSAGRRVFPSTAGRLACQTGPSWYVEQLKPAPGMHCSSSSLHPSFAHLVAASIAPLRVGPVGSVMRRHEVEYSTDPRGPRSGPCAVSVHRHSLETRYVMLQPLQP